MYTDAQIKDAACDLTHRLADLLSGHPTASVYMAIAYTLASMELHAKRPDREGLFKIIGGAMDEYIEHWNATTEH